MSLQEKLIAAGLLTCRTAEVAERADFRCECACMICNRVKNRFDPREVLGSKYTRADAIRVATDYIQAQHEATTRHYVSKYRSIIQEASLSCAIRIA